MENEIIKMRTKLRRIEELFKKKRDREFNQDILLPNEIEKHFSDEIMNIKRENDKIKE